MKHSLNVTAILVTLFLASQLLGVALLYDGLSVGTGPDGKPVVTYRDTVVGPRPDMQGPETLGFLLFSVAVGTLMVLVIIRLGTFWVWKGLFFFAASMSIWIALAVLVDVFVALGIALIVAAVKVAGRSVIVHNLSEPFMYSGIALIITPLLDVTWALALLAVISIYDFWAVFRSRHMVTIAKGLQRTNVFAGLSIPYRESGNIDSRFAKGRPDKKSKGKENVSAAVLGGGDIVFPLIFTGTVLQSLVISGMPAFKAFMLTLALPAVLTATLIVMLWRGTKGKFYPAMPALSAGCVLGYLVVLGLASI